MRNLILLMLLALGIWYLLSRQDDPPPAPAVQAVAPPKTNYSGVRTFYSSLNDPPVPANGHGSTSSAVNLGNGGTGQAVGVAPGAATAAPAERGTGGEGRR